MNNELGRRYTTNFLFLSPYTILFAWLTCGEPLVFFVFVFLYVVSAQSCYV